MNQKFKTPTEGTDIQCNIKAMSKEQREFFSYWLFELSKGRCVDTENNITYIYIYLNSISEKFVIDKNLNQYLERLDKIHEVYKHNEDLTFLFQLKSDAYLFVNNHEKAWYFLQLSNFITIRDIINIRGKCKNTFISGDDVYKIVRKTKNGLTKFGLKNIKLVTHLTQRGEVDLIA